MIFLKEEADLSHIDGSLKRGERLKAVFNALVETHTRYQKSLVQWLDSQKINYRTYYITNLVVADELTLDQINILSQRDDVKQIVGNPTLRNKLPITTRNSDEAFKGPGGNIVRFGADRVWNELKINGNGIVVAGQDTGVKWNHLALKNKYRGWDGLSANHDYSWHDSVHKNSGGNSSCGYDLKSPCDDHGHGTHTIGTVSGDDGAGNQIGVAPGAKWIACRNMDAGIGTPEMYIECFQWFLAPWPQKGDPIKDARPELAPHVINNSWGCPKSEGCEGGEFISILKALRAAGIFVVVSAGNDGDRCSTIKDGPAFHSDLVLSVGAINHRNDAIASFSSRGPSVYDQKQGPHVTAPGVNVRSAVPGGGYAEFGWSGTSMAGPHLVGLVALLWSADPNLIGKIEETEKLIKDKADPKTSSQTCGGISGSLTPNNTYGFGISNAYDVVKTQTHLSQ
jgi:subtilisin family serine protease